MFWLNNKVYNFQQAYAMEIKTILNVAWISSISSFYMTCVLMQCKKYLYLHQCVQTFTVKQTNFIKKKKTSHWLYLNLFTIFFKYWTSYEKKKKMLWVQDSHLMTWSPEPANTQRCIGVPFIFNDTPTHQKTPCVFRCMKPHGEKTPCVFWVSAF